MCYDRLMNSLGILQKDHWDDTLKVIQDKVLSDERTAATTISHINRWWSNCKDCDWYKSTDPVLTEAILST